MILFKGGMNMNKTPKARVIYDNYDLWEKYPDDTLKEIAKECEWI